MAGDSCFMYTWPMVFIENKKVAATAFWIVVLLIIGGVYMAQRSASADTPTPPSQSSGPDIQLKVREQGVGETGPSNASGAALQPSVASNNAVNTAPACDRQGTNQAQVQGGACNNQEAVKGLLLLGQ